MLSVESRISISGALPRRRYARLWRDKAGSGIGSKGSANRPGRRWQRLVVNLFHKSVRRDADRGVRDARAPHFTRELEKLHLDNRHVRDKIRQQLQVLRDAGLLIHVERGEWHLP